MKKESRTRNPTQNNVDLCPIHTADADETKLSSRVASAVWTYPSAVVTRWLQNCKLGHGRRLRCAFASPNPSAVVANSCTHRRCRRDETRQFRLVGVGGVYWALQYTCTSESTTKNLNEDIPILSATKCSACILVSSKIRFMRIFWVEWKNSWIQISQPWNEVSSSEPQSLLLPKVHVNSSRTFGFQTDEETNQTTNTHTCTQPTWLG